MLSSSFALIFIGVLVTVTIPVVINTTIKLNDLGNNIPGIPSQWTAWTACDRMCRQGYKFRDQNCNLVANTTISINTCLWNATEIMSCYNCTGNWTTWTGWGACNSTNACGMGTKVRTRTCYKKGFGDVGIGNCTEGGNSTDNAPCEIPCPVFGEWVQYPFCSTSCGKGIRMEKRICTLQYLNGTDTNIESNKCEGPTTKNTTCVNNTQCAVAKWQEWSTCSNNCGNGTRFRKMICEFGLKYKEGECDYNATEIETCIGNACSVANWTDWSEFTECNTTCGLGMKHRHRNCTLLDKLVNNTFCGNISEEYVPCNINNPCPVPTWSNFTNWTSCSVSCGKGDKTRNRTCFHAAYGNCSGDSREVLDCEMEPCPVPILGVYSEWFGCDEKCDETIARRERNCTLAGKIVNITLCNATRFEEKFCKDLDICQTPSWGTWGTYSSCSEYCGTGLKTRTRKCVGIAKPNVTITCIGDDTEQMECFMSKLCRKTILTEWSSWGDCDIPVYESLGVKKRTRDCITMTYYTDLKKCDTENATSTQCSFYTICPGITFPTKYASLCQQTCNQVTKYSTSLCSGTLQLNGNDPECSVAKSESEICTVPREGCDPKTCTYYWSQWGECTTLCGEGTRTRVGDCLNSKNCNDTGIDLNNCTSNTLCPVDGNWGAWQQWGACSRSCGGGVKERVRYCNNPAVTYNGRPCFGASTLTNQCNLNICPIDGGFGNWTEWSGCTQPCNNGTMSKTRKCDSPFPEFGGQDCKGPRKKTRYCNSHSCIGASVNLSLGFVEEVFTEELNDRNSSTYLAFKEKLLTNLNLLYGSKKSPLKALEINSLRNGSVIANFTIFFTSSGSHEVLVLQNAIEDLKKITNMTLVKYEFLADNLPPPPLSFNISATGSETIKVNWAPVSQMFKNYTILGYIVFYKEYLKPGNEWHSASTTYGTNSIVLTNLLPYTSYTVRIVTYHSSGNGLASQYKDVRTHEGVPSKAPSSVKCTPKSDTMIHLIWIRISNKDWNGFMRGYAIYYKVYGSLGNWKRVNVTSSVDQGEVMNLTPYKRYELKVGAYTGAGPGPMQWTQCMTLEGVPSVAPIGVTSTLNRSPVDIFVHWNAVTENVNGRLSGYRVYYGISRNGTIKNKYPPLKYIDVSKDATSVHLKGFSINSEVTIYVSCATLAGHGPKSIPVYQETCRCPENVYTAWYSNKPYMHGPVGGEKGIFHKFLKKMVNTLCGKCKGSGLSHDIVTVLHFDRSKDGRKALRKDADSLLKKMDSNCHIHTPVFGKKEDVTIMKDFKFIPLVLNSGSAFIVKDPSKESKVKYIVQAVVKCWPVVLVSMLMAALAGIFVWSMERMGKNEEFSPGFIRGAATGLWWAFVSMTTMGYGDITPRSAKAKIITIAWMLIGPVLNAIIVSVISTSLTSVTVEGKPKIYGNTVAAVYKSYEYNLVIRKNGKPNSTGRLFNTVDDCINAVYNKETFGALVNSLSAISKNNELFSKGLKIVKVYPASAGYGMAIAGDFIALENEIRTYVHAHQSEITSAVKTHEKNLQIVPIKKNENVDMFDYKSGDFKLFIICSLLAIGILAILGAFFEYIIKPALARRKNTVSVLQRSHCTEEALTQLVTRFHDSIHDLVEKQDAKIKSELVRYFSTQGYVSGYHAYWKYGSMADDTVKREIFFSEIMLKNLRR